MSLRRCARILLSSLPKQLCRLIGRRLLTPCSLSVSFSRGTITLVFHALGKVEVCKHDVNSFAISVHSAALPLSAIFHRPVETPSCPGEEISGASESTRRISATVTGESRPLYH